MRSMTSRLATSPLIAQGAAFFLFSLRRSVEQASERPWKAHLRSLSARKSQKGSQSNIDSFSSLNTVEAVDKHLKQFLFLHRAQKTISQVKDDLKASLRLQSDENKNLLNKNRFFFSSISLSSIFRWSRFLVAAWRRRSRGEKSPNFSKFVSISKLPPTVQIDLCSGSALSSG